MKLTEDDRKHIQRLQTLRDTGEFNMFTEVKSGLEALFESDEAEDTYQWTVDNFEYYRSGEWVDLEISDE